jgi:hypothetical protein
MLHFSLFVGMIGLFHNPELWKLNKKSRNAAFYLFGRERDSNPSLHRKIFFNGSHVFCKNFDICTPRLTVFAGFPCWYLSRGDAAAQRDKVEKYLSNQFLPYTETRRR